VRKVIVYIATSVDGYIARPDGDVAWLDRPMPKGNYGMGAFYKSIDTVLMGRKTYDLALKFGQESYPGKKNYIFSRARHKSRVSNVEFVNEAVGDFMRRLRSVKGKNIWLVGGGELIGALLDEGQIDEFIIHVIPIFIGEGIPLIHPRHRSVQLTLLSSYAYPDGVVRLHYSVLRESPQKSAKRKSGSKKRA
jgi:dihydrofolate reductase